uniref:DEAD/DEAH box helicase n=1 Tax=uncultured Thiodictyon sp. TaxID=1846217 RepID=UPI0025F7D40E
GISRLGHTDNEICRGYENDSSLVNASAIVFSTLASAVLNFDKLVECDFDLVVVDEASMVSLPYIFSAAHLAQLRIVIAGDFCQLQPISLAQTTLSESIYHYLGTKSNIQSEGFPPYLVLLETQYRMTSSLSGLVSRIFYGGRLRCGRREPEEKHSLFFINTDSDDRYNFSFYSVALESYYNPLTLAVLESLIFRKNDSSASVLVITPFRAQQVLVGHFMANDINSRSRCLTVHRAQGTEADIVVFDLTAHAKTTISGYPRILESNGAENLLDVALSRARDKLYILGSLSMIAVLAKKMKFWNKLYYEIKEQFVISPSSLAYSTLQDFDPSLLHPRSHDPEFIVAVDPAGEKEFFREFVNSSAPRKYYFLPEDEIPNTSEETGQITFRSIRRNRIPEMTIWGNMIALRVKSGHRFTDSRLAAAILRRIALGHIIDLQESGLSDTLIISCDKCGGNRDLVYDSLTGCYVLQCERCRRTIRISRDIGNRIAQIYDAKCPICGSEMVPRKRSTDNSYSFFGCSNYPRCNGISSFGKFSLIAK